MRRFWRPLPAAALVACLAVAGCTPATPEAGSEVPGVPTALTVSGLQQPVKVGVLVDQDSTHSDLAAGARVAEYRFHLGGADVALVVAGTKGTVDGAKEAAEQLLDEQVVGVIAAFHGQGLAEAVQTVVDDGAAVLALYPETAPDALPDGAWWVGPSPDQAVGRLIEAVAGQGLKKPCLVVAGGGAAAWSKLKAAAVANLSNGGQPVDQVVQAIQNNTCDSVVVDAPAAAQAAFVIALRGRLGDSQTPLLLTADAADPAFGRALDQAGVTEGVYATVGVAATDNLALATGGDADRLAAFFSCLRVAAGDDLTDLTGRKVFVRVAPVADVVSHDAVVALVRAAERTGGVEPSQVRAALAGLVLDGDDGLAGPALDLTGQAGLADEAVTLWWASTDDSGLRPASPDATDRPGLFWVSAVGQI